MTGSLGPSIISAIAGFLGVLVGTALIPWVRERIVRRRAARYLAIRIACLLDTFVDDCSEVASDWGEENKVVGSKASKLPTLIYPPDLDWHSINHPLMYEVLSLPTAVERQKRYMESAIEYADLPDHSSFFEERNLRYAQLGLRVNAISTRLREKYRIPEFEETGWTSVGHLKEVVFDIEKFQRARVTSPLSLQQPQTHRCKALEARPLASYAIRKNTELSWTSF
jgi:xanthosine utilization system XapX-like protein